MNDIPAGFVAWEDLKAQEAATRTPAQQREYDEAGPEVDAQMMLTELVYRLRTQAGLSQAELARRMGVRQPYISELEHGGRTPTVATLNRLAYATGNRLVLTTEPLSA
jgi:ribosome-binding protein aMBF1 (putative translation factor)